MKRNIIILISLLLSLFEISFAQNGSKLFTLEDFTTNYTFYSRGFRAGKPINDGKHYLVTEARASKLTAYSYETGKPDYTLLDISTLNDTSLQYISDYSLSKDEKQILLESNVEEIYRRSYKADFLIYNVDSKTLKPLSKNGKQQLATFSPDGKKVAFVRDNNLFIADLATGTETAVTQDGKFNFIINGAPDWVYEEEFEFNKAFEWSPDGKYLAWIRFDESKVHEFSMTLFQGAEPAMDEYKMYPGVSTFKYPKAGDNNSIVTVNTYNLADGSKQIMDISAETDIYIPRIRWTNDPGKLAIFRLNRLQNLFEILFANPKTGVTKQIYSEKNDCYIDEKYFDDVQFLDDNQHFAMMSEKDGWSHVYIYNLDGSLFRQVTKGEFDVMDLYGVDVKNKKVYFSSAEPQPYQRTIYEIGWDGKNKKQLSTQTGTNSAVFSSDFSYYFITCSNSTTPSMTDLYNSKHELIRNVDDGKKMKDKLSSYKFNTKEFFSYKNLEGTLLYGYMIKPVDFDASKKYPVLLTQYSGPNSQSALDRWGLSWDNYMAQSGYLIVCVDGRGTGGRGEKFRKCTYLQLGKYETSDQIETAKYLGTLPFVDASRIGIWGWSFGGYISSSCMVKGDGVFKAAIAVAPVTNWRYYDNIYTERFMRTPAENPDGYDQNSPLYFADKLQGKLLLCHGSADDNVHLQNTMEFAERLVQADKQFEMQIYNNRNHGIYGGNTTHHLYTRMTNFLLNNL